MGIVALWIIIVLAVVTLFMGTGSLLERVVANWQLSLLLFAVYIVIRVPIRKMNSALISRYKDGHKGRDVKRVSRKVRILYMAVAVILLVFGCVELLFNFIPFDTVFYAISVTLGFPLPVILLSWALYDPVEGKISWKQLK